MTISQFLMQHVERLHTIIATLPNEFSSHHVIQKFAPQFEREYIEFLYEYRKPAGESGAFRDVHQQIARFLLAHQAVLRIEKVQRTDTQNVFGDASENQGWRKV